MKTNVLIFTSFLYPSLGGISSSISAQAQWLQSNGCTVEILSLNILPRILRYILLNAPAFAVDKAIQGTGFLWTYLVRNILFGVWILAFYPVKKWEVIITHDVGAFDSLSSLRKRKGFQARLYLVTNDYYAISHVAHGSIKAGSFAENYAREREKEAYLAATAIVVVDSRLKEYVTRTYGIEESKVLQIMNWVDTDSFTATNDKAEWRVAFSLPIKKFLILVPRRLVAKTGVEYSIRAMEIVQNSRGLESLMVIAGTGDEEMHLKSLVGELGLKAVVSFLGAIPHDKMPALYKAVDCVVIPSVNVYGLEEATSIAALEGMSSGVPVVASDIGGLREIVRDGYNGLLVRERSPEALASALISLSDNPNMGSRISMEGRAFAIAHSNEMKRVWLSLVMGESAAVIR